jgi:hypothetical protein
LAHPQAAATLIALVLRRSLAANVLGGRSLLGGQRSKRKSSTGGRAAKRLSEWADFNSANTSTVVVFAPGLSRGNRPGDTERDSGHRNQHLLPAHGNSPSVISWTPEALGVPGRLPYCNAPFFDLEFPLSVPLAHTGKGAPGKKCLFINVLNFDLSRLGPGDQKISQLCNAQ